MQTVALDPLVDPLNPQQRLALEHLHGPLLILAGAGSGKTRALTHRVAKLMQNGVAPWQILAVTFTNRAAEEMKTRIRKLLDLTEMEERLPWQGGEGRLPTMGTFHSICARILRRDIEHLGRDRNFVIYDDDDQEKLMKEVLKELAIDESALKPRAALGYVGRFKSEAISPEETLKQITTDHMRLAVRAYTRYQQELLKANAVDFDDLILETVRLFHTRPEVLDRYQETWRYLHVDEYQDTNHAQYLFITLLAQKYRNLCVIGDPDQSIYAFRGADIRNILEFEKEYPDLKAIKLEQNYRSVQPILTAADAVIAANPNRPKKKMWTSRKDGPNIVVQQVRDEQKEAEEALRRVRELQQEGVSLNDQVVLYRTNAQSRLFEEACMRAGIPYRIVGGLKFYMRKEVKDVLAYLHLLTNPYDTVSLMRILNVPTRKIGATTIAKLQTHASVNQTSLWAALCDAESAPDLDAGVKGRIEQFVTNMERYRGLAKELVVSKLTEKLLRDIGMEQWLRDGTEEGESRWQNVEELLSVMQKYDQLSPETSIVSFLEEASLVSEVDKLTEARSDALTLMTIHLCKGLEFESVMIAGCEDGIFPHSSSLFEPSQLEEERRLMYVAMTRARTHLRIFYAQSRLLWGERRSNPQSRFLDDLPEDITERKSDDVLTAFGWGYEQRQPVGGRLEPFRQGQSEVTIEFNDNLHFDDVNQEPYREGSRIEHPSFGKGTIVTRRGDVVDITFDSGQKKTFALSIAPLRLID